MELHGESSIGLFTTDVDLNIQIWDSALERMTGINEGQATARPLLDVIPELSDRPSIIARFRQALSEGTVELLASAFHKYLIRCEPAFDSKHFSEMRQQVTIAPLRDGDVVCGLIVTIEDVTRRMENELDLAAALRDPDESVRLDAARAISAGEAPLAAESVAPVIEALDDPNWKVRRKLVEGMTRRGADDAIAALLRAFRDKHLNFGIVNGALQILRGSSVDTSGTLVEFLRSEEPDLRMHSALALGEQGDSEVIPALISALDDEDPNVRYHVIEALGKLRATSAINPLTSIAESGDFFLSFAALDAIAEIGETSASPNIVPLLQDNKLREVAVRTLGRIGKPSDIASIVVLLDGDERLTVEIAKAAVHLYQRYQGESGVGEDIPKVARESITDRGRAHLIEALATNDSMSLPALIPFAGWFPDDAISERLCELIDREEFREQVVAGLLLHEDTAVGPLIKCLDSEDDNVRAYAARSLGRIGDTRAVRPLINLLEGGTVEDARSVIDALGSIGDSESADVLRDCLIDPDPNIRESAVRAVGRISDADFAAAVIGLAKDSDETVRQASIEQIPAIVGHEGLNAIVAALETDTPRVKAAAARALAQLDHEDAIPPLRRALDDADAWTRYFAVRGLGALGDKPSADRFKDLSENDPAEQVRMAAKEVTNELGI